MTYQVPLVGVGLYPLDIVSSAIQKCIRRGRLYESCFWASELLDGKWNYGNYLWKRLTTVASEDIGLANPNVMVLVRGEFTEWKKDKDRYRIEKGFNFH